MKSLAIITTHPIQYYAPLFSLLSKRDNILVRVFYTWGEQAKSKVFDPGFGAAREWDIPLLNGYEYEFVTNTAKRPGSSHFNGIINPDLIQRISAFNPDALLVIGWAFNSHLKVMRYFKGKLPVYFRGDSTLLDEPVSFSFKTPLRRIFLTWVYRYIDIAFYVGTNNYKYYRAHGVADKKLVYAPHAIDNDRFFDEDGKYAALANEWKVQLSIPVQKFVVLFAGKLEPKKNPLFIVKAAAIFPELHFIIAGNGILEAEVKAAGKNLNNLTILPFQNQSVMPVLYRLCNVFVLPSKGPGETWGLAINEAMACGRLIVASNKCGGATDLVVEGENGYVIEPNIEAMADALNKIISNHEMIEEGGKISINHIQNFSFRHIAESIEKQILN